MSTPSLSPPAAASTSGQSRQTRAGSSAALNSTITSAVAFSSDHPETNREPHQHTPTARSRAERMEAYMQAYARGEVGKDRDGWDSNPPPPQPVSAGAERASTQPIPQRSPQPTSASPQPQYRPQAPTLNEEEAHSYHLFLASAQHRALQRHDLATRDVIWKESLARSHTRLAEVNAEKAMLEHKIVEMEAARERYKAVNRVEVSEEQDFQEGRRWEEWLRVRRGIEVGGQVAGDREGGGDGDKMDEDGGVDI